MRSQKGQSLFEVVVALGMMAAILVGIVSLAAMALRNSSFSKNKTLANRYVQEATEWLRRERDINFKTLKDNVRVAPWCLKDLGWSSPCGNIGDTILKREVLLEGADTITATVRVYWNDSQGDHEVRSVTYFTDWRQR